MPASFEGVVILGMPRSGTTLLRRLINAHPAFVCPPETNLFSGASRFLQEDVFAGGLSVGVVPGLGFAGFERDIVIDRLREFLFGFWREIRDTSGKAFWVEKTAVDIFHIDAIEELCGDRCRYVCLVRHPLDVIVSLGDLGRKMQSHLSEVYQFIQRYQSSVEAYAHAWVAANSRLNRFIDEHPDWCIQLRYEDVVEDPNANLDRLFSFLGQPTDSQALIENAMSDHGASGLGDWKTYKKREISISSVNRQAELGQWTISHLAPMLNPLLSRFDYDPIKIREQTAGQEGERSRSLARMVASMSLAGNSSETDE